MIIATIRTKAVAILAGLLVGFMAAGVLSAHQFHTSTAELDWNHKLGCWEVCVRIHAGDLDLALTKRLNRKLDIESELATESIQQYVASQFQVVPLDAVVKPLGVVDHRDRPESVKPVVSRIDWVGHECQGGWMWLYFELTPPETEQPLALVSQLLAEINEDQINIVSVRNAARKRTTQQTHRKQIWVAL